MIGERARETLGEIKREKVVAQENERERGFQWSFYVSLSLPHCAPMPSECCAVPSFIILSRLTEQTGGERTARQLASAEKRGKEKGQSH